VSLKNSRTLKTFSYVVRIELMIATLILLAIVMFRFHLSGYLMKVVNSSSNDMSGKGMI
jgi:hypothetical protein